MKLLVFLSVLLIVSPLDAQVPSQMSLPKAVAFTASGASAGWSNPFTNVANLYVELFGFASTNWTGTTVEAASLATWLDMSGQGNNFTNWSSKPPSYGAGGPNGWNCINLVNNINGDARLLKSQYDLETNAPNTIFVLATETSSASGNTIYDSVTGGREMLRIGTAGSGMYGGRQFATLPNFANTGNWFLFSSVFNGANTVTRTNGVTVTTVNVGGSANGQMGLGNDSTVLTAYKGKIFAVLAYARALPTNELCYVEQQLSTLAGMGLTVTSNGFDPGSVWADRVVANGGAYPSDNTKVKATKFCDGLITDAIYSKMIALNFFATDNLIACTTPIISNAGSDPWVNHSFISGDLTINGLIGNGTSKYLDTGVKPSDNPFPAFDFGFTVYLSTSANEAAGEFGAGSGVNFYTLQNSGNASYFDTPYDSAAGRIGGVANAGWAGYMSGNRVDQTHANLYKANSGVAHTSIGSTGNTATDARSVVTSAFPVFCTANPTAASFITRRISFGGIHRGLSSGQSSSFFNRIQTFRTDEGGGFQ